MPKYRRSRAETFAALRLALRLLCAGFQRQTRLVGLHTKSLTALSQHVDVLPRAAHLFLLTGVGRSFGIAQVRHDQGLQLC